MSKLWKIFLPIALAMFASAASLRAQDTITNVMSPVASYQFYDTVGAQANSPIVSPVAAYQFYDVLSNVVSIVSSYQFYDTLDDMGTNSIIMSQVPGYYYGPDGINLGLAILGDGTPQLTIAAAAGQNYAVQFSTNLVNWVPLTDLTFGYPNLFGQFNLVAPTNSPMGFYRVIGP
jgi:hypothetical protein